MISEFSMAKKKKKLTKTARILLDAVMVISLGTAAFSGYQLWKGTEKYRVAGKSYDDLRDTVMIYSPETKDEESKRTIDWNALAAVDSNIAAWIELEGSTIDYPVVHGTDNSWYLKHLMDGTYNDAGTVFIDAENHADFSDRVTVMYAHHMLDDPLMFAEVENYKDQSYYDSHKKFLIHTPEAEYEMYPVAGYVTSGTAGYIQLSFASDEEYTEYVNSFIARSTFVSEETIGPADQALMLSTCSYDIADGRYVLIGRLEKVSDN